MMLKKCPNCGSQHINLVPLFIPGYEQESYYCMNCDKEFAIRKKSKKVHLLYSDADGNVSGSVFKKKNLKKVKI